MGAGIEFGLLGPVEGRLGADRLVLGPTKQRLVLAVLLLAANRPVPIERLVDLTWPQSPPTTARTAIHGRISRLRSLLAAAHGPDHGVALVSEGSGYTLRVKPASVDAHRFTALLGDAREAESDRLAIDLYDEAFRLWRGRPLDGTATEDIRGQLCGHLEDARLLALEDQADAQLRVGLHRDLVDQLMSRLQTYPMRERTACQLALALYRCAQSSQALQVCQDFRWRLHDELGIDPGPALRTLELAILRNDDSLAPPPANARTRAVVSVPRHLPAEAAGFTGRATEVRRLTELLSASAPATMVIAVVSGPAGVGKTALAIHCGHLVAGRYQDGQLYVNLRGHDPAEPMRPVDALAQFLRALDVQPGQIPLEQDDAALLYRSLLAGRRFLVVLDNACSAEQVRPLLPGAAGSAVLVTSRDDLRGLAALDGAWPLRLDMLTPAESLSLLGKMIGTDRVNEARDAAAELARLCDHLPLALRIAGVHLATRPDQPIETYVRALGKGNRLNALAIPEDPRAALRAAFDLSYRALTTDARRLFRRLGLVPGPDFTASAAAALAGCSPDQAGAELDRLDAAHLVRRHAPGRYQFHDLLRLYAAGRAQDEDSPAGRDAALLALLDHYLYKADAAARMLYPYRIRVPLPPAPPGLATVDFDDAVSASAWLDAELPNVTAAIRHAARTWHNRKACLLADAVRGYFAGRIHGPEWFAMASTARQAAAAENDALLSVSAELSLGEAYLCHAQHAKAREHYLEAGALARKAGWPEGESAALGNLGAAYQEAGDLREAADCFTAALVISVRTGAHRKQVIDLMNLGGTYALMGRLRDAAGCFHRAQEINRQLASPGNAAIVLHCLGTMYRSLGELTDAVRYLTEALTYFRDIGELRGQASVMDSLANVYADTGRHDDASRVATDTLALAGQIGDRRTEAAALNTLGVIHSALGEHREALACHTEARRIATESGNLAAELDALVGLADAQVAVGQHTEAEANAHEALTLAREAGHRIVEGRALTTLAGNAFARGAGPAGEQLAREALAIHTETGYRLGMDRTRRLLGTSPNDVDPDGGGEGLERFVVQLDRGRADVVLQVRDAGRARDRQDHGGMLQQPRQRQQ